MPNQPAEAFHVRQYLINCFIPTAIANLFTSWVQANRYLSGDYDLEESLYLVTGYTRWDATITYLPQFGYSEDSF